MKERQDLIATLAKVQTLFQLRAICAAMDLPLPVRFDHRVDLTGLDDGPYLPGCAPRKKPEPKTPEELAAIRERAWQTRRANYGERGHR